MTVDANVVLAGIGASFGLYVLYYHILVKKKHFPNTLSEAIPIFIGTLAWATACYDFFALGATDVPTVVQRAFLVISWMWLAVIAQKDDEE